MRTFVVLGALSALLLGACEPRRTDPPVPSIAAVRAEPAPASLPAGNTSVPSAESVLAAKPEVAASGATPNRTNKAMSPAQESAAMPMGGQANDHSAPLSPAGRASAP